MGPVSVILPLCPTAANFDANKAYGCECEAGYYGVDCTLGEYLAVFALLCFAFIALPCCLSMVMATSGDAGELPPGAHAPRSDASLCTDAMMS